MKYLRYKYNYWVLKEFEADENCIETENEKIRWRDLTMAFAKFKENKNDAIK
jgi:hypothetical protein